MIFHEIVRVGLASATNRSIANSSHFVTRWKRYAIARAEHRRAREKRHQSGRVAE
jgi:hypothetical protein